MSPDRYELWMIAPSPAASSSGAATKPTACDAPSCSATPQAPSQRPASFSVDQMVDALMKNLDQAASKASK